MKQEDVFRQVIAALAHAKCSPSKTCADDLDWHVEELGRAIEKAQDAFTKSDQSVEVQEVLDAVSEIMNAANVTMLGHGAYSRNTGSLIGYDRGALLTALKEERDYQDSAVRERFNTQSRVFEPTMELTMMATYYREEVKDALEQGDYLTMMNGIR